MAPPEELVRQLAELARLALTLEEEARFSREFRDVVAYVGKIDAVRAPHAAHTTTITGVRHVVRDDRIVPSLLADALLRQAPDTERGLVRVPAVL